MAYLCDCVETGLEMIIARLEQRRLKVDRDALREDWKAARKEIMEGV
jgi:hypothetical protein